MRRYLFVLFVLNTFIVHGQNNYTIYGGLQIWGRYTSLNPGSTIGNGESNASLDFSIRRYRIGIKGQPYDYLSYNINLGHNNLSRYNNDQPPKLLDAYVSWHLNDNMRLTVGKHAWGGLSRYAVPSTFSNISSDVNYSAITTLNVHDDFFRRLAVAWHGQLKQFDYRLVLAKPFTNSLKTTLSPQATYVNEPTAFIYSGYVKYQFFDHESLSSAFSPWSYLGGKKILNVGAGFYHQEKGTQSLIGQDTVIHPMTSLAVDLFLDLPAGNRFYTFYTSFQHHDLGPNFVRMVGANNPAGGQMGLVTLNGKGNSFPVTGTGNIVFTQFAIGYNLKNGCILQPNASIQFSDLDFVESMMTLVEGGVSYYMDKQKSKLSFSAQRRPILVASGEGSKVQNAKWMLIGQYQIRF